MMVSPAETALIPGHTQGSLALCVPLSLRSLWTSLQILGSLQMLACILFFRPIHLAFPSGSFNRSTSLKSIDTDVDLEWP